MGGETKKICVMCKEVLYLCALRMHFSNFSYDEVFVVFCSSENVALSSETLLVCSLGVFPPFSFPSFFEIVDGLISLRFSVNGVNFFFFVDGLLFFLVSLPPTSSSSPSYIVPLACCECGGGKGGCVT